MSIGKIFLLVVGGAIGLFVVLAVIGGSTPERHEPELLATGIVGCPSQDIAVALARALSTPGAKSRELSGWSEQNGCHLVPAGTYVTAIEEEAGHSKVTKVSTTGVIVYLLGLPRPTPREKLNAAVADLKKAVNGDSR